MLNEEKKEQKNINIRGLVIEIALYLVLVFLCIFIIPNYVIQRTIVDGPSMENTLHHGENLLVEKFIYKTKGFKRFDIVVFYPHGKENKDYYVKRIIGMPGEKVQIIGSDIYINDEILDERYGKDPISYAGSAKHPIILEDDEYFVLGDNREVSLDSRYDDVGPISLDKMAGRVVVRIWPLNKIGGVE